MYGIIIYNAFENKFLIGFHNKKKKKSNNIYCIRQYIAKKKSPLYFKGIKAAAIDIYLKDGKHVLLGSVCDI